MSYAGFTPYIFDYDVMIQVKQRVEFALQYYMICYYLCKYKYMRVMYLLCFLRQRDRINFVEKYSGGKKPDLYTYSKVLFQKQVSLVQLKTNRFSIHF